MTVAHYTATVKQGLLLELPAEATTLKLQQGDVVEVDVRVALTEGQEKAKREAAIALLNSWIAEGLAADEETRRKADEEVEEFKRNMNANAATCGESLPFPEVPYAALDEKLQRWRQRDGATLRPHVSAQTLFAQWAEEDAKMTEEEREAEDRLWEEIEEALLGEESGLRLRGVSP